MRFAAEEPIDHGIDELSCALYISLTMMKERVYDNAVRQGGHNGDV